MGSSPASLYLPRDDPRLELLDPTKAHTFILPVKQIHDSRDVVDFKSSRAYKKIMTFLFQLNKSMYPQELERIADINEQPLDAKTTTWSGPILQLRGLLQKLEDLIDDHPPDLGPRRFGNVSFRRWSEALETSLPRLLEEHLPESLSTFEAKSTADVSAQEELSAYFLGSFGSAQRLDYGTGHELSFLAFLGSLWMLGGFSSAGPGTESRGIVLGVMQPYLHLIRRLIQTYTLEPAGSHGVWGLDDHSFLPYIFGSAQYGPTITLGDHLPQEGSHPDAPQAGDVTKAIVVAQEREHNLYFAAIGFICDVKKGAFWEHSPILFDISGVTSGWAKINKGMIKMYDAEVLGKFPVVQHFPFGSLFSWERDPNAPPKVVPPSTQPFSGQNTSQSTLGKDTMSTRVSAGETTSISSPRTIPLTPIADRIRASRTTSVVCAPGAAAMPGATMAPWAKCRDLSSTEHTSVRESRIARTPAGLTARPSAKSSATPAPVADTEAS